MQDDVSIPHPRQALVQMLKIGFWMLVASQFVALGIYLGIHWQEELFLAQATKTEATLLGVNPDVNGYRVQVAYPVNGTTNRTSVLVLNPPNIRIGEKIDVYVDPSNFWHVEIPGPPKIPLGFLQIGCAGFAFFFYFFMALGAIATSTVLHSPRMTAEIARLRNDAEMKKSA